MSQIDSETITLGGQQYEMFMLPPMVSHDLLVDVAKMVGPALGPLLDRLYNGNSVVDGNVLQQEIGSDFFSKTMQTLFSGLNKGVLRDVITAFAEVTKVDGKNLKPIMDIQFRGKLDIMYSWIGFGMKVQWGKSLSALTTWLPGAKGAIPTIGK